MFGQNLTHKRMKNFLQESKLKPDLDARRYARKADKLTLVFLAVFGAILALHFGLHIINYVFTPDTYETIDGVMPRNDTQMLNGYNN